MAYNKDKVDEMTLALLYLVTEKGKDGAVHGSPLECSSAP
jgi:hypothetical protein